MKYYGKDISAEALEKFREFRLSLQGNTSAVCSVVSKNRRLCIESVSPELVKRFSPHDQWIYKVNPVRAYLLYPLHVQNRTIGLIVFADTRHAFSLTVNKLDRIQRYITQVAAAIQNARLYEESERTRQEILAKNALLESLSSKLSKYLSPQIYKAIFSGQQDVKVWSSRKKLTIFFSDIVDFTEMTDGMESEELTDLLNEYLNEMSRIALRHGGTVDKFIGDAIMIFFGDPESRGEKEDALSCVMMALEMRASMKNLQHKWESEGIRKPLRLWKGMTRRDKINEKERVSKPMQIRIGINSGFCTVGNFGSEHRLDYTIIGGQVNLASRLEHSAEHDQILISHETYALVKDRVACEKKGILKVKGVAYPIQTYQVLDLKENVGKESRAIRQDGRGYSIAIDPDEVPRAEREKLLASLHQAVEQIQGMAKGDVPDTSDKSR